MTIQMTATQFIQLFANGEDAIDHIIACNNKGFVQVSENTLPAYTFRNERFVAYADWQPQTHSFDVRIQRWYVDDETSCDAVVRFDYTDGIDLYWNQLSHDLDGALEQSEMHWQDNIETHHRRERDALALQTMINSRRLSFSQILDGAHLHHHPQRVRATLRPSRRNARGKRKSLPIVSKNSAIKRNGQFLSLTFSLNWLHYLHQHRSSHDFYHHPKYNRRCIPSHNTSSTTAVVSEPLDFLQTCTTSRWST